MNFKPFHKNGLIGSSRTQFFSPAFNNTPSQAEAKSLQNRNEFDLIGCEYGTKPSSDTSETDSVRVYFWLDKRATLSDLAVQQLQDYRRDHYLLVDVAVKRCPASYWDVLDIVKNPLLASRVQEPFDKLHAEGRKAGLRFVSPMFGNIYDFADSLATKGSRGYYRSTTHSAEGFFS